MFISITSFKRGSSKTNLGEHIVIEMQARRHVMFDERALFYASHTYVNQLTDEELKQENWYRFIKAVYAIQFLDFDTNLAKGITRDIDHDTLIDRVKGHKMKDENYIKHYIMTDKYSGQTIGALQMIQIELPRANTFLNLKPSNTKFQQLLLERI